MANQPVVGFLCWVPKCAKEHLDKGNVAKTFGAMCGEATDIAKALSGVLAPVDMA